MLPPLPPRAPPQQVGGVWNDPFVDSTSGCDRIRLLVQPPPTLSAGQYWGVEIIDFVVETAGCAVGMYKVSVVPLNAPRGSFGYPWRCQCWCLRWALSVELFYASDCF